MWVEILQGYIKNIKFIITIFFQDTKYKFISGNLDFYLRYNKILDKKDFKFRYINIFKKDILIIENDYEKNIYWSPCLDIIGTVKSTLYSAISLAKFSKQNNQIKLINVCGEWNNHKKLLKKRR